MRFNALKSTWLGFISLFIVLYLLLSAVGLLIEVGGIGSVFIFIFAAAAGWYFNSLWINTYYIIDDYNLIYRSRLLKRKIPILSIQKINVYEKNSGFKIKQVFSIIGGMIIKYGHWSLIYIAPENKDEFLAELLIRNPKIIIED